MTPDSDPTLKPFAGPVRWLGIGFMAIGALTLAGGIVSQVATFDPEELAGLVVPLLFVGAGVGLMRLARRMRDDPAFEIGHLAGVIFAAVGAAMVAGGVVLTFQDPGGIALIVFGLVFLGAGWMARKLFVTPQGMKKVAVQSGSATVRHGLGRETQVSSTTYIDVPEDATEAEIAEAREAWKADRLAERPDWARGVIEQEANRHGNIVAYAAAGFLALSIVMFLIGAFVDEFFYLFGVFMGIVSILLAGHAVLKAIRARKFGAARFHMKRSPIAPGEHLEGEIRTEVARERLDDDQFTLTLSCRQIVRHRSNDRTHYNTTVLWSDNRIVPATGNTALTVPVSFTTPGDRPSATMGHDRSTSYRWQLEATAAAPGIDFVAVFDLPVLGQD